MAKLNTSTPSGFPEFSPAQQRVIQHWKRTISEIFEANGFPILETPLVERAENFEAKGGNPKEIYILDRLLREESIDQDKDKRAIRFDHTVPLALYVARHFNELAFPFRRSVIGPVMRGERAQKGRFRQFDQCDIDVIGSEKLSLANDAQMVTIIAQIFEKLMPKQKFVIRINNRKLLTGVAKYLETDPKDFLEIYDEKDKVDPQTFQKKLDQLLGINAPKRKKLGDIFALAKSGEEFEKLWRTPQWEKAMEQFTKLGACNNEVAEGAHELFEVCKILRNDLKVDPQKCIPDISIARGLDYYTGTVYETNLIGYEKLGSVCSGGRYDDLAKVFMGKNLPGVGISIGLTRLLWQLFEAKLIDTSRVNNSDIIILSRDNSLLASSLQLGEKLRSKGISTEIYMEDKKIQKQFDYAKKMGIPCRVIVGDEDIVVESDDLELKMQIENLI